MGVQVRWATLHASCYTGVCDAATTPRSCMHSHHRVFGEWVKRFDSGVPNLRLVETTLVRDNSFETTLMIPSSTPAPTCNFGSHPARVHEPNTRSSFTKSTACRFHRMVGTFRMKNFCMKSCQRVQHDCCVSPSRDRATSVARLNDSFHSIRFRHVMCESLKRDITYC